MKIFLSVLLLSLTLAVPLAGYSEQIQCSQVFVDSRALILKKGATSAVGVFNRILLSHKFDALPLSTYVNERKSYIELRPGITLKDGAIIEGSIQYGGIQPHYRVNLSDVRMRPFLEFAQSLKRRDMDPWEKVNLLRAKVQEALPNRSYNSLEYHLILRKFRSLGKPIELGDYIESKSGVCRENALLMHFMLIEAGFNPKFQYWNTWRKWKSSVLHEDHAANTIDLNGESVIVDSYFNYFNGKKVSDLMKFDENGDKSGGIVRAADYPKIMIPTQKNNPNPSFTIKVNEERSIEFEVAGRSVAERKFAREEDLIRKSAENELVPVEWIFTPSFLPFGHVSLRVGEKLFEFGSRGWRIRESSSDDARAFLFNNPFSKAVIEKEISGSVATYSIAVPMMIKKSSVSEMELRIRHEKDEGTQEFCILMNNCNHQLLAAMPEFEELSKDKGAFFKFSAVMTFRRILLESPLPSGQPVVYPVSGTDSVATSLREQFPTYLYKPNSMLRELLRVTLTPFRKRKE